MRNKIAEFLIANSLYIYVVGQIFSLPHFLLAFRPDIHNQINLLLAPFWMKWCINFLFSMSCFIECSHGLKNIGKRRSNWPNYVCGIFMRSPALFSFMYGLFCLLLWKNSLIVESEEPGRSLFAHSPLWYFNERCAQIRNCKL